MVTRTLATDADTLRRLTERVQREERFGFDTESSGPNQLAWKQGKLRPKKMVNVYKSTLTGFSLAFPNRESFYIPVTHRVGVNAPGQPAQSLLEAISGSQASVAVHNLKHEIKALRHGHRGFELGLPKGVDTMVWAWLLGMESGHPKHKFGLKFLAPTYLGWSMEDFESTTKGATFDQLDPKQAVDYACDDSLAALGLMERFQPEMEKYNQFKPYWNMEAPLIRILADIEDRGLQVDSDKVEEFINLLEPMVSKLEDEWEFVVGCNINSPVKVAEALYGGGHWDSKLAEKTKTGYSVNDDSVQAQLQACKPGSVGMVAAQIKTKHAAAKKLLSTYTRSLTEESSQYPDGRFHADHNHTGTVTGRLSVSRLHQLPNPEKIPPGLPNIRDAFVAGPGMVYAGADYSQIELRIIAHLAGCGDLYEAFLNGEDPHQGSADRLGITRPEAKNGNYALVYGTGAYTMSKTTGKSREECKTFLADLRAARPELGVLAKRVYAATAERGFVRTIGGRMRRVPELADNYDHQCWKRGCPRCRDRKRGERIAFNTPAQGGARDIITIAMVKLYQKGIPMNTQVHDELVLETPEQGSQQVSETLGEVMRTAVQLRVPLLAEPHTSKRLGGLK